MDLWSRNVRWTSGRMPLAMAASGTEFLPGCGQQREACLGLPCGLPSAVWKGKHDGCLRIRSYEAQYICTPGSRKTKQRNSYLEDFLVTKEVLGCCTLSMSNCSLTRLHCRFRLFLLIPVALSCDGSVSNCHQVDSFSVSHPFSKVGPRYVVLKTNATLKGIELYLMLRGIPVFTWLNSLLLHVVLLWFSANRWMPRRHPRWPA
jgi:hypothetical protein